MNADKPQYMRDKLVNLFVQIGLDAASRDDGRAIGARPHQPIRRTSRPRG